MLRLLRDFRCSFTILVRYLFGLNWSKNLSQYFFRYLSYFPKNLFFQIVRNMKFLIVFSTISKITQKVGFVDFDIQKFFMDSSLRFLNFLMFQWYDLSIFVLFRVFNYLDFSVFQILTFLNFQFSDFWSIFFIFPFLD